MLLVCANVGAAFGSPLETLVTLPDVPPPHVRFPDGFDEQGCALIAHEGKPPRRVCPRPATPSSSSGGDWIRYLGYEGPPAAPNVRGDGVVLLSEALNVSSSGWWRAAGLVRNEAAAAAREVRVSATLVTSDDRPLGTTTVVVPVHQIRPGEPAPFEVRTVIPAQLVRRVKWNVTVDDGTAASASTRMAEIEVGRIASCPSHDTSRLRPAIVSHADGVEAVRIGWGILRNWGPRPIERPTVVGMWIDELGRAVRLVDGRLLPSPRAAGTAAGDLLPGGTRTFELFEREQCAPRGAGWRLALWQTTS
jgi:hypothetical protein